MDEADYPRRFEVVDRSSGILISYEDQSPESGSILMQRRRGGPGGTLLEEQLMAKDQRTSLDSIIESWEQRVDDHQDERPPFKAEDIPVELSEMELAQGIREAASGLDDLVERLEAFLEETYQPDLSEARYELRKAAEYAMCAAHRTKELADG